MFVLLQSQKRKKLGEAIFYNFDTVPRLGTLVLPFGKIEMKSLPVLLTADPMTYCRTS